MSKSSLAQQGGKKLLAARERTGLSQEDMAKRIPTS